MLNPPELWSKDNINDWLISIGDALENMYPQLSAYLNIDGKQVAILKRRWCPRYHGNILDGSVIKRKPDVILVDQTYERRVDNKETETTWQKVHAVCEVTITERKNSRTIKETV